MFSKTIRWAVTGLCDQVQAWNTVSGFFGATFLVVPAEYASSLAMIIAGWLTFRHGARLGEKIFAAIANAVDRLCGRVKTYVNDVVSRAVASIAQMALDWARGRLKKK